jgi:hypothetical protein
MMLESWQLVWRQGFVPNLNEKMLKALKEALEKNDPRLIQGATTTPPPLMCVRDWPVEAADAIGYMGWQGDDRKTVGETEEFFAMHCFEADSKLGEPAACRWFLNWFDDTPRDEMRRELLKEVNVALGERCAYHPEFNYFCVFPDCKACRDNPKHKLAGAINGDQSSVGH